MIELNLPKINAKIRELSGKRKIFDPIRKKYVVLTPEEWVRQHVIQFLIHHRKYPKGLLNVESQLYFNNISKRTDIVVYDKTATVLLVVECKAADQPLVQSTIEQAAVYAFSLQSHYVVITNGLDYYCYELDYLTKKYTFLKDIPFYEEQV